MPLSTDTKINPTVTIGLRPQNVLALKGWTKTPLWWLDGRDPGKLDAPMVGYFEDGVGAFYADDTFAGRPVRARFLWTLPRPDHPHWEQAFSTDGGVAWETNWAMDFTRSG